MSSNASYPPGHPDQPCYAAFAPCGCIDAVTVDRPEYARDTANIWAGWEGIPWWVRGLWLLWVAMLLTSILGFTVSLVREIT